MTSRVNAAIAVVGDRPADDTSRIYLEGIVSGLLGLEKPEIRHS